MKVEQLPEERKPEPIDMHDIPEPDKEADNNSEPRKDGDKKAEPAKVTDRNKKDHDIPPVAKIADDKRNEDAQ